MNDFQQQIPLYALIVVVMLTFMVIITMNNDFQAWQNAVNPDLASFTKVAQTSGRAVRSVL